MRDMNNVKNRKEIESRERQIETVINGRKISVREMHEAWLFMASDLGTSKLDFDGAVDIILTSDKDEIQKAKCACK